MPMSQAQRIAALEVTMGRVQNELKAMTDATTVMFDQVKRDINGLSINDADRTRAFHASLARVMQMGDFHDQCREMKQLALGVEKMFIDLGGRPEQKSIAADLEGQPKPKSVTADVDTTPKPKYVTAKDIARACAPSTSRKFAPSSRGTRK